MRMMRMDGRPLGTSLQRMFISRCPGDQGPGGGWVKQPTLTLCSPLSSMPLYSGHPPITR